MAARRAVLLSGSLGLGHEMLVRSCSSVLRDAGWEVQSLDCMKLLGRRGGSIGQRIFTRVVRAAPSVYDGLHFAHLRTGSPLAQRIGHSATRRLVPALRRIFAEEPPDLILSVFATGAAAAATLQRETGLRARTVVLCTDVTLHRLWVEEGTDLFLGTSSAAATSVHRYLPRARVAVVPTPVRPAFYDAPPKLRARATLGIPADATCALVIDSGWGFGPLEGSVTTMARAGIHVLAVAGRQRAIERRFRDLATTEPRIHPFGFVEDVPRLMAAADVVISMPGATTCAEARVVGRPLVLIDTMPGHGRENLLHELEVGAAVAAGPTPEHVVASVQALLERQAADREGSRPRVPRWEPSFAAALGEIGIEIADGDGAGAASVDDAARRQPAPAAGDDRTNGLAARRGRRPMPAASAARQEGGARSATRRRVPAGGRGDGTGTRASATRTAERLTSD